MSLLAALTALFRGIGELLGLLERRDIKKAGRNEEKIERFEEENEILKEQRDNDVINADDAERLWTQWEDNSNNDDSS